MKKSILMIAVAAFVLCLSSCQKEKVIREGNNLVNGGATGTTRVLTTADLTGTNWTANFSLGDLVYAMTGMSLNDYGCQFPEGFDTNMVYHLTFDPQFAHITFSGNISMINVAEVAGEYTMDEIQSLP